MMVVFVQQLGQAAPLRIEMPSWQGATVGLLKALISLAIRQPSHHMQLVFNGQLLASDSQPISDTGITRESSVMLRITTASDDTTAPPRAIDGTLALHNRSKAANERERERIHPRLTSRCL